MTAPPPVQTTSSINGNRPYDQHHHPTLPRLANGSVGAPAADIDAVAVAVASLLAAGDRPVFVFPKDPLVAGFGASVWPLDPGLATVGFFGLAHTSSCYLLGLC